MEEYRIVRVGTAFLQLTVQHDNNISVLGVKIAPSECNRQK